MSDPVHCPYCKESINAAAIKCHHCGEFLPGAAPKNNNAKRLAIASELCKLAGKALLPATIVLLAVMFKPSVEALLVRVTQAEFLGTKLAFTQTKAFIGELTPVELYYLIGSAANYGKPSDRKGALNLDHLQRTGRIASIDSLKKKDLLLTEEQAPPQNVDRSFSGTKLLATTPTDKGKNFLIELGLKFENGTFPDAP